MVHSHFGVPRVAAASTGMLCALPRWSDIGGARRAGVHTVAGPRPFVPAIAHVREADFRAGWPALNVAATNIR